LSKLLNNLIKFDCHSGVRLKEGSRRNFKSQVTNSVGDECLTGQQTNNFAAGRAANIIGNSIDYRGNIFQVLS